MNPLRQKLGSGKTIFGSHISLNDCRITELMGYAGFDYLWIDTEHTSVGLDHLCNHLIAAKAADVPAIVRVPWNDPVRIKPVLEMGPDGIVIPMINSYEEAQAAISSCRYPPRGIRGYGPQRANHYGMISPEKYFGEVCKEPLLILQIEHQKAVQDLDRMLSIEEVDVFLLGPCDLAASMDKIGQWHDRQVEETLDQICEQVHRAGKFLGVSYGPCTDSELCLWRKRNVDMISISGDTAYLMEGAVNVQRRLEKLFLHETVI